MLYELAEEYKFKILAMEVMPDHIHLLLDCKPQFFISDMMKIMKGIGTSVISFASRIKTGTVGRTLVEAIVLCSHRK